VNSDAQHRLTGRRIAAGPTTFRYVSCWPAKDAAGRSSAVALDRTAQAACPPSRASARVTAAARSPGMAIPSMVRRISALSVRIASRPSGVQARQPIEPTVGRRRVRHDPPEGVRRHAKASRHPDAVDPRQRPQARALAANDRDPHLVNLMQTQHVLLAHRDTSEAAVLRCPAPAGRITGASSSAEPRAGHVRISRCPPPEEPAGRSAQPGSTHTRTSPPSARNHTASPTGGPTSPRPPSAGNNTRTSCPCLRPFLVRPTILGARPGSCRKPPGPPHVKSGKEFDLLAFAFWSSAAD